MTTWVNTPEGRGRVTEYQNAQHGGHVRVAGDGFEGWYRVAEVDGFDPAPFTPAPNVDLDHLPWEPVPTTSIDNPFGEDTDPLDTLHYEDGRATTLTSGHRTASEDVPGDWANIVLLGEEGTEPDPDDPNPMVGVTSAWSDVQEKAKQLRAQMALNVTRDDGDYIEATIRGSSGSYETYVQRHGSGSGNYAVTGWGCTCGWGQWAWKRQHTYVGRMCFTPGTFVTMADGSSKMIEEIEAGDLVRTHTGKAKAVKELIVNHFHGDLVGVKPRAHRTIWSTPEHPWYATEMNPSTCSKCGESGKNAFYCEARVNHDTSDRRDWVEAADLTTRHWLSRTVPVREVQDLTFDMTEFIDGDFAEEGDSFVRVARNRKYGNPVKRYVTVDDQVAYLIGLYLGDGGSPARGTLAFYFGKKEMRLAEFVKQVVADKFGIEARIVSTHNMETVRFSSNVLVNFFQALAGSGAHHKRLDERLMDLNDDLRGEIFRGWYDADFGWSVSRSLISQMEEIAESRGYATGVIYRRGEDNRTEVSKFSGADIYQMRASQLVEGGERRQYSTNFTREGVHHVKVEAIESKYYEGPVFNLAVEDDESYKVEGFDVHNCSHALALYLEMQSREYYRNVERRSAGLLRIAGKVYTPEEEAELIAESGTASQLQRLRLDNSHYLQL